MFQQSLIVDFETGAQNSLIVDFSVDRKTEEDENNRHIVCELTSQSTTNRHIATCPPEVANNEGFTSKEIHRD